MVLHLQAVGDDVSDLESALREALRLVEGGYLTGTNQNETGSFNFEISEGGE